MTMIPEMPKLAVLDGDWIAYTAACWAENEGFDYLEGRIEYDLKNYTPKGCDAISLFSCSRNDNYRRDFWPVYKAHRDGKPSPQFLGDAIQMMKDKSESRLVDTLEADDLIGLSVSAGIAMGVAIDKDMRTIPGWHWNPRKEDAPVYQSEAAAYRFFCKQLVMGDSTDGIYGMIGKGEAHFEKNIAILPEDRWMDTIIQHYSDHFHKPGKRYVAKVDMIKNELGITDPYDYFLTQARCIRLLQNGDYNGETKEIRLWTPEATG